MDFLTSDFDLMANFERRWRWTDERWNLLPEQELLNIKPFKKEAARKVNEYSLQLFDRIKHTESHFTLVMSLDCGDDVPKSEARETLQKHLVDSDQFVCVSWDSRDAVLSRLDVFCNYWDDFCYPSSDDVIVWPASEMWVLIYWHYETFQLYRKGI